MVQLQTRAKKLWRSSPDVQEMAKTRFNMLARAGTCLPRAYALVSRPMRLMQEEFWQDLFWQAREVEAARGFGLRSGEGLVVMRRCGDLSQLVMAMHVQR